MVSEGVRLPLAAPNIHTQKLKTMNKFLIITFGLFISYQLTRLEVDTYPEADTQTTHTCTDSTHTACDGECECDGFECE